MSSSHQVASRGCSQGGSGGTIVIPPTPAHQRFSSPPPPTTPKKPKGKSFCSPPPPPRHHYGGLDSFGGSEPATESVQSEINAGRSILNSKHPDASAFHLTRKCLRDEFECEDEHVRNVRPRFGGSGLTLVSPSHPRFPPMPTSPGDVSEEDDEDMPKTVPQIRLQMRSTRRARTPNPTRSSFIPIRPQHDDEEEDDED